MAASYPFDMTIVYGTNAQYRQCFRELCGMTNIVMDPSLNLADLDEETLDEQHFDMEAASRTMDAIWDSTKSNVQFQKIYEKAAAIMLSQDKEIGLAVLISYDYLDVFHACFCRFMRESGTFAETSPEYLAVLERFAKLNRKS
jgi:hypothetical protein